MNEQEKTELHSEIKAEILLEERLEKERNKWLNYLSISTVLIALCTTMASYFGGNYGGTSMTSQIKASDQWAFFQSKSIKEYIYETQLDNMQVQLMNTQPGNTYDTLKKNIATYQKNIAKYKTDKDDISKAAKELETTRDNASKHSTVFGLAVVFLEISILLSSIAGLVKNKPMWYLSMVPGLIGIVYFLNGFWLFF